MCTETQNKLCHNDKCDTCFKRSFASSHRAKYWNYQLNNNKNPREYRLHNHNKFWFTCGKCKHDFDITLNDISNKNRWCGYCGDKRLCHDDSCVMCLNNSIASHPKAQYWNSVLNNGMSPRQIRKNNQDKFLVYLQQVQP